VLHLAIKRQCPTIVQALIDAGYGPLLILH
jgi:hypothetical protein